MIFEQEFWIMIKKLNEKFGRKVVWPPTYWKSQKWKLHESFMFLTASKISRQAFEVVVGNKINTTYEWTENSNYVKPKSPPQQLRRRFRFNVVWILSPFIGGIYFITLKIRLFFGLLKVLTLWRTDTSHF